MPIKMSGTKFPQALADQRPVFEKSVYSRKLGVRRPAKPRKKVRFL
jgi:hypothetical protein